MKYKSSPQSQQQTQAHSFETPKKKISSIDSRRVSYEELHTPKSKRRSSTKKSQRKRRSSESDEEKIDKKTEENIQQAALKNNLSEDAVKKILKKVVGNDHVLAIVKLKEEEMEKNSQDNKSAEIDDEDDEDRDVEHTPKITRSKAKVLNKKILPITSPSEPSEASILIQLELGSDDEDEEYEPGKEEIHSDDEQNSSLSDIDSQPRTPKTPYTAEEDTPTKYTNDGLFKIPRDRKDSSTSLNDQDYIIAKRTRSKVSLATTSIETIESTFQPPDISPDMYERDNELDTDWLEFLNVLTKPINQTIEEDDETDPEYIAADQIPIDKEELREVNISKKELNDLVDELFSNLSDVDFDEINKYDIIPGLFRTKQKSTKNDSANELNRSNYQSDQNSLFQPSQISTPVSSKEKSVRTIASSTTNAEDDSIVSILSNLNTTATSNESNLLSPNNQTSTLVPINVVNPFQGASIINGVIQIPQYQQVLVQIPTIDILKMQVQQQQQSELNASYTRPGYTHLPSVHQCTQEFTSRHALSQHKLFQHLHTDLPTVVKFADGVEGFTFDQRNILNQQLRMHVQFATQNFLQVYGHPGNDLWKFAPKFKSFVTELDDLTNGTSINIENLKPAVSLINKWEEDLLQAETAENKEYVESLFAEYHRSQKALMSRSTYIPKLNRRVLDAVMDSDAFPYPHILPKIPFRMNLKGKSTLGEFIPMEDYLIAFYLEKFYDEYHEEHVRNKRTKRTRISLERICDRICSRMCSFRQSKSTKSLYRYVIRRKSKSEPYNPIQYYFKHNKAPPFKHKLIKVNFKNKRTTKDFPLSDMPIIWAQHAKHRLAIENSKSQEVQICNSKPTQKVSPRVRCKTVESVDTARNSLETNTSTPLSPITRPSVKPVFIVKPRNSSDTSGALQYEIFEINSAAQYIELSSNLDLVDHINTKEKSEDTNTSSEDCNISKCYENRKRSKQLQVEQETSKTLIPSETNPNESVPEEDDSKRSESLGNKTTTQNNKNCVKGTRKIVKKYSQINRSGILKKLTKIVHAFKENSFDLEFNYTNNKLLLAVYNSVQTISIYMSLVEFNLKMANVIKRTSKEAGDDLNRRTKLSDDVVESQEIHNPCNTSNVVAKRNPKAQRSDNTRLMLLRETKEDINEKDLVYAQNFMDKVEETYGAENKLEKVTEFLQTLQTFNQSTDKVEDLYYKMEQLFLPDHPELAELFLTFLLPGQAAQIGKFMDHFMLTNMNNFINKLNIFFNKQPAQIRKIMTCLRELSNEDDLKMEQIKAKIFPLLKGNPLLTEWFKQCFPHETNYDHPVDEYESLSFHRAENTHLEENDVYENIHPSEIIPDPVENPCHTRYLNGRVYYGSRILLPAKLSFLVVTASDQNAINEVAKSDITGLKHSGSDNETDYRCVHSIKQYGDNKMKECQKNQLETPDNSAGEDVDIEKSAEDQNCSDATDDADVQSSELCIQGEEKNLSNVVESPDTSYNTCDDLTLKAHGIRLNPTVHQSNVIKSEDLLCLLDPVDDVADKSTEESIKNSPKKQATRAQRKSPNSKKSSKRSPTNNRKVQIATNISPEESQAIRTAKRLKRLIESDDIDDPDRLTKKPKLSKYTKVAESGAGRKKKQSYNEEVVSTGIEKTETNTINESPPLPVNTSTIWSRDEDKIVLEQIKMGFTNEETLVLTLHEEKLPNRSYNEIYDRFKFLMDVIANL